MSDRLVGFFQFVLGDEEGFLALASKNTITGAFVEGFFSYPEDVARSTRRLKAWTPQANCYFCPTVVHEEQRVKEAIRAGWVAWADLDECDPDNMLVKPTIVVQTSPGRWQAYWKFKEVQHATDIESLNKRIAYYHADQGADRSGWDLTQLLRVPTTINHKYRATEGLVSVDIVQANTDLLYDLEDFAEYPEVEEADATKIAFPETLPIESSSEILDKVSMAINPRVWKLLEEEPLKDWSRALWQLELLLFDVGLSREAVFIVCREAACNKYKRDGRSDALLWKDVVRAGAHHAKPPPVTLLRGAEVAEDDLGYTISPLLSDDERLHCEMNNTFIEEYIEWASKVGDAAQQYHQAGAFVLLSAACAGTVKLPTSFGTVTPNLWFMILADTTLTRKTTAMDMAVDLLTEIDDSVVLATDGSIEGLMTSLSTRPGKASIFLRDEFSGLLEMLTKRDYAAGMLETLTKLYDGKMQKRVLRKEIIEVKDPVVLVFAGGIRERILQQLDYEHINSGFIPRFIFLTAKSDVAKLRPIGPPSDRDTAERAAIQDRVRRLWVHYNTKREITTSNTSVNIAPRWDATLTDEAWVRYNRLETEMVEAALNSYMPDLMVPVFDRLSKSGLKASILLAASRMEGPVRVTEGDIVRAFWYVEQWRYHTLEVVRNIGKTTDERLLERIHKTIQRQPGISRSEVMRNYRLTARQADNLFSTLQQRGLIMAQSAQTGGRSAQTLVPVE